jgi:GTP cyclohydrolase II
VFPQAGNPEKIRALEEMGLKVVERVSLLTPSTDAARNYLLTKKENGPPAGCA